MSKELYEDYWAKRSRELVGSPALRWREEIYNILRASKPSTVVDIGTGPGHIAETLALDGYDVVAIDIADSVYYKIDKDLIKFRQGDIVKKIPKADFGICIDVLEHISPKDIDKVLKNIFSSTDSGFLVAATFPLSDNEGNVLHTIVEDTDWWAAKFSSYCPDGISTPSNTGRYCQFVY